MTDISYINKSNMLLYLFSGDVHLAAWLHYLHYCK